MPMKVRRWLLFIWAALLPLHQLPWSALLGANANPPVPRAGAGEWMFPFALLASAPWLTPARLRRAWVLPPLLLVVGFAPSVVFSIEPRTSAIQLGVLLYVAAILLIALQAARHDFGFVLLTGFVCGAVASSVWGWWRPHYDEWLLSFWPRPVGPTESPNMLAVVTVAGAIASLVLLRKNQNGAWRIAWLASASALLVTTLFTLSHVVAAAIVAGTFALSRLAASRRRFVAAAGMIAFAASIAAMLLSVRFRILPLSASFPFLDLRPSFYVPAHTISREVFADSPITGVGLECFIKAWSAHDDGARFASSFAGGLEGFAGPRDPHSTWLGYPAEAGVFGVIVLVGLTALAIRARRARGAAGTTPLALDVLLVFAAASGTVMDVLTNRELALVIGVLVGLPLPKKPTA